MNETFDQQAMCVAVRVEVSGAGGPGSRPVRMARRGTAGTVVHVILLVACAVVIYLSCEWFVNAVEWLGRRLQVGRLAVGTILAAFGTALPESVVTFVAVVFGDGPEAKDIGVGAAMGGPLALATVAYGVTGWMMLARRRARAAARVSSAVGGPGVPAADDPGDDLGDTGKLARDQTWFLVIFAVKVALGLVAFAVKPWLGLLFFAAYAVYFWREIRADDQHGDGSNDDGRVLGPLLLQRRRATPANWSVVTQTLVSLVIIFVAAQLFVHQLEAIGPMLGLPAAMTALLLSPIATELPEIMNAVVWVRQGKTSLALANISGSMMIQATVPSGLGLLFTPWLLDPALLLSGLATMAAIVYLLILLRTGRFNARTMSLAAVCYLAFAACLVPIVT